MSQFIRVNSGHSSYIDTPLPAALPKPTVDGRRSTRLIAGSQYTLDGGYTI